MTTLADVQAAQEAAEPIWTAYRAAAQAAHTANERVVALAVRAMYPDAHVIVFDYDGDADGTWLIPGPVYDHTGQRLDEVDDEIIDVEDDLRDALDTATRDLFDYLVGHATVPSPTNPRVSSVTALGLIIPDVLDTPQTPAEPATVADGHHRIVLHTTAEAQLTELWTLDVTDATLRAALDDYDGDLQDAALSLININRPGVVEVECEDEVSDERDRVVFRVEGWPGLDDSIDVAAGDVIVEGGVIACPEAGSGSSSSP